MGGSRFDSGVYASTARSYTKSYDASTGTYRDKSVHDTFTSRNIDSYLDPRDISIRESCDSDANPNSTPIIVGLDVTGSMGQIAYQFASTSIGQLMTRIYEEKPVSDPHLMFMGIGDAYCDSAPLQVSQFEADTSILEQLMKLYVEGGGGGNNSESYQLPWFFASRFCKIDSFGKRGKKGYIFTIGDECAPEPLTNSQITSVFGNRPEFAQINKISAKELFDEASKEWEIFHILVEEGNYCRGSGLLRATQSWEELLGSRLLRLDNRDNLEEVILAALKVANGVSPELMLAESRTDSAKKSIKHALNL